MDLLRDATFHVYKAYQLPTFLEAHTKQIREHVANYIYIKYTSSTSDLIPRYRSADDVNAKVEAGVKRYDAFTISHIAIEPLAQVVAFIEKDDKVLVLVKSPTPIFLVQMLESLQFSTPLILQLHAITGQDIQRLVNGLASELGTISLTFAPIEKTKGDALKEIMVSIPKEDVERIGGKHPMDAIFDWLAKTTSLKFVNLQTKGLESAALTVTNGQLRLGGSYSESMLSGVCIALA